MARVREGHGEWYAKALACLEACLASHPGVATVPWLTEEEETVYTVRMVLTQTDLYQRGEDGVWRRRGA